MEVQEKSPRYEFAEKLSNFIIDNALTKPYGGDIVRGIDRKNRAYYGVTFSVPGVLDGNVSVYSHKYFVLKFRTRFAAIPPEATLLFKSQDDLLSYMKAAFVDHDIAKVISITNALKSA
jgi:hypothetical protein